MQAEHQAAFLLGERVLHLVAIPPRLGHAADRLEDVAVGAVGAQATDVGQRLHDLLLLEAQLRLVAQGLPLAAAALVGARAVRADAQGRGVEELDDARLGEAALAARDADAHAVAGQAAAHEEDEVVDARDALAAVGEPVDADVEDVTGSGRHDGKSTRPGRTAACRRAGAGAAAFRRRLRVATAAPGAPRSAAPRPRPRGPCVAAAPPPAHRFASALSIVHLAPHVRRSRELLECPPSPANPGLRSCATPRSRRVAARPSRVPHPRRGLPRRTGQGALPALLRPEGRLRHVLDLRPVPGAVQPPDPGRAARTLRRHQGPVGEEAVRQPPHLGHRIACGRAAHGCHRSHRQRRGPRHREGGRRGAGLSLRQRGHRQRGRPRPPPAHPRGPPAHP